MRFAYCKGTYTEPGYEFSGTIDFSIHNIDRDILFTYSIIDMMGQWKQIQVMQPIKASELLNKRNASSLEELYSKLKSDSIKLECFEGNEREIERLIRDDIKTLPEKEQKNLMTMMAEAFA